MSGFCDEESKMPTFYHSIQGGFKAVDRVIMIFVFRRK